MREISTEKIKIGEHVLIDGVEYVTEMEDLVFPCERCAFHHSESCTNIIDCDGIIYVKVKKEPKYRPYNDTEEMIADWKERLTMRKEGDKMKYGKIYTYENRNEAEINKIYVFSDNYKNICETPEIQRHSELKAVHSDIYPFECSIGTTYQFVREVIEEPELMTYRQLAEWLAKRNGLALDMDSDVATNSFMYPISIENKQLSGDVLLIRPWDSDEWIMPTVDIYERDLLTRAVVDDEVCESCL